ncbi:MAG: hypothetical protein ABS81_03800 [Pseudonocardia sp. SCN 72-86]|uniref:hypothetical protein n=1 Tax=uncultured Microbacterium sp. TaxID=191216 RepID=UPI00086BEED8|nr:hypothetical protein [uncultured Microbacterium sp.]ODU06747.1 MAG: hypothetical protein ABS81_03800 [Pseudonocardia sp. SCN 72-86]
MSDEKQQTEVARFYTRSRKFPRLIGRLHDGTKIPGGPYTVTQGIVAAVLLALGLVTRGLWGTGTILVDIPIVLLVAWGGAWGAGRLPATRRNVASIVLGAFGAVFSPAAGKYQEQTVKLRPPHFAGGTTTISVAAAPVTTPTTTVTSEPAVPTVAIATVEETPAPTAELVPAGATSARTPVTGVERLLAQARGSKKE